MKLYCLLVSVFVACIFTVGCADIAPPTPQELLRKPLGDGSVKIGMTKFEVLTIYRDPDTKNVVVSNDWAGSREEWFYSAGYSAIPLSAGYLSEDIYLYFDGENLTNISKTRMGRGREKIDKNVSGYIK